MKDVVKSYHDTGEYKIINGQRVKVNRRKRRSNLKSYYAIAAVAAMVLLLILCMTVFFQYGPDDVTISGVTLYTKEQILAVGGVSEEGNLMRTDTDAISERLKKYLVYIDEAQVKKSYPSKLIINVTEAQKAGDIEFKDKYYVISKSGKLLESGNENRTKGIPVVKGLDLKNVTAGNRLETKDTLKTKIFNDLLKQMDQLGYKKITEIDLTDRTNIQICYNDRIRIYIGSSVDMDYKLKYVKAVIDEKLSEKFKGILRYNGMNSGISAIPDSDSKKHEDNNDAEKPSQIENADESDDVSDENYDDGEPIQQDADEEQYPDENVAYTDWQ